MRRRMPPKESVPLAVFPLRTRQTRAREAAKELISMMLPRTRVHLLVASQPAPFWNSPNQVKSKTWLIACLCRPARISRFPKLPLSSLPLSSLPTRHSSPRHPVCSPLVHNHPESGTVFKPPAAVPVRHHGSVSYRSYPPFPTSSQFPTSLQPPTYWKFRSSHEPCGA